MTRGPIWGNRNRTKKSQNLKSSSELTYRMYKMCKLLLVYMYISKPLRWKHLELSEKKIKNQQGKKCQKYDYFVHSMSPSFWHQPFHNLVRLFPGLFWGQPIDSAGGLAVFVNKINNLATQSWKKKFWPLLHRK